MTKDKEPKDRNKGMYTGRALTTIHPTNPSKKPKIFNNFNLVAKDKTYIDLEKNLESSYSFATAETHQRISRAMKTNAANETEPKKKAAFNFIANWHHKQYKAKTRTITEAKKYVLGNAELTKSDMDQLHSDYGKAHHSVHTQKAKDHEEGARVWFHANGPDSIAGKKQMLRHQWHTDRAKEKRDAERDMSFLKEQFHVIDNGKEVAKYDKEDDAHRHAQELSKEPVVATFKTRTPVESRGRFVKVVGGKYVHTFVNGEHKNVTLKEKTNTMPIKTPNVNRLYEAYADIYKEHVLDEYNTPVNFDHMGLGGLDRGTPIIIDPRKPQLPPHARPRQPLQAPPPRRRGRRLAFSESTIASETTPQGHEISVKRKGGKYHLTFLKRGSKEPLVKEYDNKDTALYQYGMLANHVNESGIIPFKPKKKPMGGTKVDDSLLPQGDFVLPSPDNVEKISDKNKKNK